jgi:hypothetical protein
VCPPSAAGVISSERDHFVMFIPRVRVKLGSAGNLAGDTLLAQRNRFQLLTAGILNINPQWLVVPPGSAARTSLTGCKTSRLRNNAVAVTAHFF